MTPVTKKTVQNQEEIKKLENRIKELDENWKRSLADYQNLLKRTESDKKDFVRFATATILTKLIPALDLLEMAASHSTDQGLHMAVKNFQDVLRSERLQEVVPQLGDPFDAAAHECTETVALPPDESVKENTIAELVLKGYKIDAFIIRPAKVKVYKGENERTHKNTNEQIN